MNKYMKRILLGNFLADKMSVEPITEEEKIIESSYRRRVLIVLGVAFMIAIVVL